MPIQQTHVHRGEIKVTNPLVLVQLTKEVSKCSPWSCFRAVPDQTIYSSPAHENKRTRNQEQFGHTVWSPVQRCTLFLYMVGRVIPLPSSVHNLQVFKQLSVYCLATSLIPQPRWLNYCSAKRFCSFSPTCVCLRPARLHFLLWLAFVFLWFLGEPPLPNQALLSSRQRIYLQH